MDATLHCSIKQMRVLIGALELYMRICLGQLDAVGHALAENLAGRFAPVDKRHEFRERMDSLKQEYLNLERNSSLGISSGEVSDHAKIGYDLMKTLQKFVAVTEQHDSGSVWHNGNILKLGSEPPATIEKAAKRKGRHATDACTEHDGHKAGKRGKVRSPEGAAQARSGTHVRQASKNSRRGVGRHSV